MKYKYSDEELKREHSKGLTNTEIAKIFNVSKESVGYRLKKIALKPNKKSDKKSQVVDLYKKGFGFEEISNTTNISESSVRNWLKDLGYSTNSLDYLLVNKKEDFIELHSKGCNNSQISKKLNISKPTVKKWLIKLNLKANTSKMDMFDLLKSDMIDLHNKGLLQNEIAEKLGTSLVTINRWYKKLNLTPNYTANSRKTNRDVRLTGFAHEAFIGHCLGDGSLSRTKRNSTASGSFAHSIKYEKYFDHKYELFKPICSKKIYRTNVLDDKEHQDAYTYLPCNKYLDNIYDNLYVIEQEGTHHRSKSITFDILNNYTEVSLAYHFMDDGSKTTSSYLIYTMAFDYESLQLFSKFLLWKFGLDNIVRKDNSIYIKNNSKDIFSKLVKPYIIESMSYKLHK